MDNLKMPPKGSWAPQISLENLLISVRLLMTKPNPDDPLMADIAEEYKSSLERFEMKAKDFTRQYAMVGEPSWNAKKPEFGGRSGHLGELSGDTALVDEKKRFE